MQGSVDGPGRRGRAADGAVPGVTLGGKARDAGSGDVWLATVDATGASCTVRRLRLPPDSVVREEARHAARRLLDARHPHLVEVQDAVATDDGIALVSDPVPGAVSLTRLLDSRQRLEPGEVVTIGLPIAQALAAAHAVGLTHGDISGDDILLEPAGRPVLAGIGVAPLVGVRSSAPDDVGDLAALLLGAMPQAVGPDAAAVAVAVAPALVDDLSRRPSADDLAESLARACVPRPVVGLNRIAPPVPSPLAPVRSLSDVRAEATGRPQRPDPDPEADSQAGHRDPDHLEAAAAGAAGAAGIAGGWTSLDPDEEPDPSAPDPRSDRAGSRNAASRNAASGSK
ncbi:MAG: protein kinase, partial [Frankia sp.]